MNKGETALSLKESGKTNQEIADELGMSAKSVRRLVSEARTQRGYRESLAGITRDGDIVSRPILPPEWGQVRSPHFPGRLDHIAPSTSSFVGLPADWAPPGYTRRAFPQDDHNDGMWRQCGGGCGTYRWQSALFVCENCLIKTPVAPVEPRRHLLIPDTQCKPGVDLQHLKWCGEYIKEMEPDVVIMIGDHYDMESLSEYDRGKRSFEGRRYAADIAAGNQGLDLLMEGISKCKNKPRLVYTIGNHEERIMRALELEPRLEGVLGYHDFNFIKHGWEQYDFLVPVEIDGVHYAHYFTNNVGRPLSGTIEGMLKSAGFSFSCGHMQGLRWGRRELANGMAQVGLQAGSFYSHREVYRTAQGNDHWRGIMVCNEVRNGDWDPMAVSMSYLQRKFGP